MAIFQLIGVRRIGPENRQNEFILLVHSNEIISCVRQETDTLSTWHNPMKVQLILQSIAHLNTMTGEGTLVSIAGGSHIFIGFGIGLVVVVGASVADLLQFPLELVS